MILGTRARVRPATGLLERGADHDPSNRPDPRDHRDRGRFLTPRLYPTAPFDPWQPDESYLPATTDYADSGLASRASM